jgi:hypothetical protein
MKVSVSQVVISAYIGWGGGGEGSVLSVVRVDVTSLLWPA